MRLGAFGKVLDNGYYLDVGLARFVSGPVTAFARFLSEGVDRDVIDGAVNGIAHGFRGIGGGLRKVQTGLVRNYALAIVLGAVLVLVFVTTRAIVVSALLAPPSSSPSPMLGFPLLTALILVPAVGAVITLLVPGRRPELTRAVGYVTSAATFGLAVYLLIQFDTGHAGYQFVSDHSWMPALGIRWTLGVDGISLFMVALTTLLIPISMLASADLEKPKSFTFWMLLLEASVIGVFLALDSIVFFVFFELVLVPMYFLIAGWGHGNRRYAAVKFFLYTATGSAFLFVGILCGRVPAPARHRPPHLRRARAHRAGRRRRTACRSPRRSGCSSRSPSASR